MAIEFNCHVCGKLLRTSEAKAGKVAKCPGCGESLSVPPAEEGTDDFESDDAGLDAYGEATNRVTQHNQGRRKPARCAASKFDALPDAAGFAGKMSMIGIRAGGRVTANHIAAR